MHILHFTFVYPRHRYGLRPSLTLGFLLPKVSDLFTDGHRILNALIVNMC